MAVSVAIDWIDQSIEKPDSEISVLICGEGLEVCFGYWDSVDECWRYDSGSVCFSCTYWADPRSPYDT